ncbi:MULTISPECIES: IclR family transcriptional regulator domain-containing protein [unclassified Cupriavidus]|uniref:IclR family transcriptional regulator domain-containing protein n=1 Tax=Cupriavidus sp. H19C3 TaxID=3241603 RepID=UPI0011DAAC64|nr:MAG: IclR family transcriptional regulator [Cupriavidus sp.]
MPQEPDSSIGPNNFVDSFARGLAVIEAFGDDRAELTLSEVAEAAQVSRAAARRLLLTLCHLGYATQSGRVFRLTPKVMRLGYSYLSGLTVAEIVEPYVVAVAEKTGESCSVCVLDDVDVVYVARASTRRVMSLNLSVGTRLPAWATAHGRILLGALDDATLADRLRRSDIRKFTPHSTTDVAKLTRLIVQTRTQGYCFVNQELESSLVALAMPLRNRAGEVVAAINLAGHSQRLTEDKMMQTFLPILAAAADDINEALRTR